MTRHLKRIEIANRYDKPRRLPAHFTKSASLEAIASQYNPRAPGLAKDSALSQLVSCFFSSGVSSKRQYPLLPKARGPSRSHSFHISPSHPSTDWLYLFLTDCLGLHSSACTGWSITLVGYVGLLPWKPLLQS